MVAGDNITLLVYAQAAISIAVIGKTDVQPFLYHELLQALDVGGTGIVVDVQAIRLIVDDIGVCPQRIKHALGNVPAGTVGAVQTDLDTLEGVDAQGDQVTHVAVTAGHIVYSASDMFPVSERQLRPVLIEYMELSVNIILHQQQGFFRHLFAVAVDQFNAIVVVRIMAGRDHDAAVEVIHAGDVSHRRRSGDVEQISVRAGSGQTSHQAVLEHIRTAAGILADDNTGRIRIAVAFPEHVVVPAQETAYLIGMICSQSDSGFATEAICTKVFSHFRYVSSSKE